MNYRHYSRLHDRCTRARTRHTRRLTVPLSFSLSRCMCEFHSILQYSFYKQVIAYDSQCDSINHTLRVLLFDSNPIYDSWLIAGSPTCSLWFAKYLARSI